MLFDEQRPLKIKHKKEKWLIKILKFKEDHHSLLV